MHQRRRLQRLPGFLLSEFLGRQLAQLIIDQRQELLGGVWVALFDRAQDRCDVAHDPEDNRAHAARQMNFWS